MGDSTTDAFAIFGELNIISISSSLCMSMATFDEHRARSELREHFQDVPGCTDAFLDSCSW